MGYERLSNQDRGQSGHCYGDTYLPSTIKQRVPSHCLVSIAPQRDWTVTGTREQPHHGPCCLLSVRPVLSSLSTFLLSSSSTSSLLPFSPCPHFILFFSCCPFLSWVSFYHLCAHTCVQVDMHICLCAYRGQRSIFGVFLNENIRFPQNLMFWDHGYHWTWSSSIPLVWLVTKLQGSNHLCFTQCWDYRNTLLHPALPMKAGDLNSGVQLEQLVLSHRSHLHCPFPSFVYSRVKERTVLIDLLN